MVSVSMSFSICQRRAVPNMDVRWKYGVFVSRATGSNQSSSALNDGSTTRARAMVRVVSSMRWGPEKILKVTATPFNERPASLDAIEEENPHEHAASEQPK